MRKDGSESGLSVVARQFVQSFRFERADNIVGSNPLEPYERIVRFMNLEAGVNLGEFKNGESICYWRCRVHRISPFQTTAERGTFRYHSGQFQ